MGNILSNKSANEIEGDHSCPTWLHFGSHNEQIPKHLRPIRASRKMQKKYEQERMARSEPTKVIHDGDQKERMQRIMHLARFGGDTNEEQQEKKSNKSSEPVNCPTEGALAGPGPKGAFRWYRGRRYTQLTDKLYPLPNDQTEQDRLRVLHYIFRWAFESMVLAPVERDLLKGIHVLCVG
ncbi:hypothetical protein BCR43DRAFT_187350 [Syncephalastrum racemosum]|uniref:Uncharacterized protein n=1 Tax=Syncephalastrum racemosum TaxID=13706 RepID=A0A1X2HQJ5_SYNRA|nr:hypothetical protein BCR43DRAFT_187350 [Syncephalastrum racemosum]